MAVARRASGGAGAVSPGSGAVAALSERGAPAMGGCCEPRMVLSEEDRTAVSDVWSSGPRARAEQAAIGPPDGDPGTGDRRASGWS